MEEGIGVAVADEEEGEDVGEVDDWWAAASTESHKCSLLYETRMRERLHLG